MKHCVMVSSALILLLACFASPMPAFALPDLFVEYARIELETGGDCNYGSTALGTRVFLRNQGDAAAGEFAVEVNDEPPVTVAGLAAGAGTSVWIGGYAYGEPTTIVVDPGDLIAESNEGNNVFSEYLPIPTLPPTCTATPTGGGPGPFPDLVVLSFYTERTSSNCGQGNALVVVIYNSGGAAAGPFEVKATALGGSQIGHWNVGGLAAGQSLTLRQHEDGVGYDPSRCATVDSGNAVPELDESNNTRCAGFDIWPTCSVTPTYTPTPTSPAGHTVSGHVAEFPPCQGSMRGVTVTLGPTGRTTQTSLSDGTFAFDDLADGEYTLVVSPPCNPFGCWPDTPVTVAGQDVTVEICPVEAADTDGDGVPDAREGDNHALLPGQSTWLLPDSDGDGLLDGEEDINANGQRDTGETNTRDADSDDDGAEDGVEVLLGMDPLVFDAGLADSDGDGLPDSADPFVGRDQDGDGYDDGYDTAWFKDLAAANDAGRRPLLADVNGDGFVSGLDALITQSYFLQNIQHTNPVFQQGPSHGDGFRYMDTSRDGFASNMDPLLMQAYFLGLVGKLPLR